MLKQAYSLLFPRSHCPRCKKKAAKLVGKCPDSTKVIVLAGVKIIHKEQSELLKKGSEHLFCSLKRCRAFSCLVPSLPVVMVLDVSVGYCHCTPGFHQPALPTISSSLTILISSGNLISYSDLMACIIMDLEQKFFL